jgi:hypothetical protein
LLGVVGSRATPLRVVPVRPRPLLFAAVMNAVVPRIDDPRLARLHAYWCEKRGERAAPGRADIRPEEISDLLPNVYLIDVMGEPPRFRFRLVGTGIVHEYGRDFTGKFLDELDLGGAAAAISSDCERVARECRPIAGMWRFTKNDGRELSYERVILPLSSDGKRVDMLLGAAAMDGVGPFPELRSPAEAQRSRELARQQT